MFKYMLNDIASMVLIIFFVGLAYQQRYQMTAGYLYVKEELNVLRAYCVAFTMTLYGYYCLENKFHYDSEYTNGLILLFFFLLAGILGNVFYKKYFSDKRSHYQLCSEEKLLMTSVVFISVSIRLVSEGVIKAIVPLALLLGRFVWLDTDSIKSIKESVKTKHIRIIESSILLVVGILLLSIVDHLFKTPHYMDPIIALIYGIGILLREKIHLNSSKK
mgnify:FL=1